jgi:hypothetical protein
MLDSTFSASTMPTDEKVNASEQTASAPPAAPVITDDIIKSHPLYQELETKHAAARKGMDEKAIENKKLKQLVVGETIEEKKEPEVATKEDLATTKAQLKWELQNEKAIDLADKNGLYSKLISEGKSPKDALDLALFREGLNPTQLSEASMRQAAAASPSAGVDRTSSDSPVEGIPKAQYDSLKAKGLDDAKIRSIVKAAYERKAKRG